MREFAKVGVLFLLLCSIVVGVAGATPPKVTAYEPQKWVLSASLGFGDAGYYGTGASPMIGVAAEYGVNDKISIGATAGHSSSTYDYGNFLGTDYKWTYGYTIIAARGSYHFGDQLKIANLDAYGGVSLGYNSVSVTSPANAFGLGYSAGASTVRAGLYAGGRYWFSPRFAGFGEVGFGLGNLVLGVSTRL
jgi:hypothetical protein